MCICYAMNYDELLVNYILICLFCDVLLTRLEDGTSQSCDDEEPQPCIMFTGLSLSAVRKLKQVRAMQHAASVSDTHA